MCTARQRRQHVLMQMYALSACSLWVWEKYLHVFAHIEVTKIWSQNSICWHTCLCVTISFRFWSQITASKTCILTISSRTHRKSEHAIFDAVNDSEKYYRQLADTIYKIKMDELKAKIDRLRVSNEQACKIYLLFLYPF